MHYLLRLNVDIKGAHYEARHASRLPDASLLTEYKSPQPLVIASYTCPLTSTYLATRRKVYSLKYPKVISTNPINSFKLVLLSRARLYFYFTFWQGI